MSGVHIAACRNSFYAVEDDSEVCCTEDSFAALKSDGTVATWGPWGGSGSGGDSTAVQDRLIAVKAIQASDCAFAAILGDGTVVTWGSELGGGDSKAVQDQLQHVQALQATELAFAALRSDGSVVTWVIILQVVTAVQCRSSSSRVWFASRHPGKHLQ